MQSQGVLAKYGPVQFVSDAREARAEAHPTEVSERDSWDPAPQIRTPAQQLRFDVARCQSARRRNAGENAAVGGGVGAFSGLTVGIIGGIAAAGPSMGWSVIGGIFGGPVVGGVLGAGTGLLLPLHLSDGLFSSVRLHVFKKIGVVQTNKESARIVKALQAAHVLTEDRQRFIVNWERLDAALNPLQLDPSTRAGVESVLRFIRDEGALYDTLTTSQRLLSNCMQDAALRWQPNAQEVEQRDTCARLLKRVQEALSKFGDGPVPQAEQLVSEVALLLAELHGGTAENPGPVIHIEAPSEAATPWLEGPLVEPVEPWADEPGLEPRAEPVKPVKPEADKPRVEEAPLKLDDSALVNLAPLEASAHRGPLPA